MNTSNATGSERKEQKMEETTNEATPSDRELAERMCRHAVRLKETLDGLAVLWGPFTRAGAAKCT